MTNKKIFLLSITAIILFTSCSRVLHKGTSHRTWSSQSNIYEVNVRQYTQAGTLREFQKHLPRLKEMGVEILWFMPITPIGIKDRKMTPAELGSYYAVRNYTAVNPEFGTMQDWKDVVRNAHSLGMKVITDWVPNHTAADHPWITNHPDFYARDAKGEIIIPFDWTDVRKLNYGNRILRDSMIAAMKFWIRETGVDGYRCDVAEEVPHDFWKEAIRELKKTKDVFMLAEGDKPALHEDGFDATYTWSVMGPMTELAQGKKTLAQFDSVLNRNISIFPRDAYRMYFTTNHDENSWNGTEFEKFGEAHKPLAVFTQTFYQSVPLIYSGQEIPNKRRLKFFVRDPLQWTSFEMAPFYSTLLKLRKATPALAADASYQKLSTTKDDKIFAYTREKDNRKVSVILNFSDKAQNFKISSPAISGTAKNAFTGSTETLNTEKEILIPAWGYLVYDYNK